MTLQRKERQLTNYCKTYQCHGLAEGVERVADDNLCLVLHHGLDEMRERVIHQVRHLCGHLIRRGRVRYHRTYNNKQTTDGLIRTMTQEREREREIRTRQRLLQAEHHLVEGAHRSGADVGVEVLHQGQEAAHRLLHVGQEGGAAEASQQTDGHCGLSLLLKEGHADLHAGGVRLLVNLVRLQVALIVVVLGREKERGISNSIGSKESLKLIPKLADICMCVRVI